MITLTPLWNIHLHPETYPRDSPIFFKNLDVNYLTTQGAKVNGHAYKQRLGLIFNNKTSETKFLKEHKKMFEKRGIYVWLKDDYHGVISFNIGGWRTS